MIMASSSAVRLIILNIQVRTIFVLPEHLGRYRCGARRQVQA
jgi:hypothetical protein